MIDQNFKKNIIATIILKWTYSTSQNKVIHFSKQNHNKITTKSQQNHNKITTKSQQNHKKITTVLFCCDFVVF